MFSIFNISLDSDIPLPELAKTTEAGSVISVVAGTNSEHCLTSHKWIHHYYTPTGELCISCAKQDDAYLLRFPGTIDYLISHSGRLVTYFSSPNIPKKTIRHLLLDQVIPRILGQEGKLVLHASAVKLTNTQAVAFIGASGRGKSTLASSFFQWGAELLTDDCLLLDVSSKSAVAFPNYHGVRLFDDSAQSIFGDKTLHPQVSHYTSKKRIALNRREASTEITKGYAMSAFFLLVEPQEAEHIEISSIKGASELITILEQIFTLDPTDKQVTVQQFKNLGNLLASGMKIYQLKYPREYSKLPLVQEKIQQVLLGK